ncbi:MAG: Transposase [Parcubacteria group bacterium GW2011_GWB1_36_5]|nr:MAG: Transposase [Parcubacteria group bacterium GW2011_GWB1_36_5]
MRNIKIAPGEYYHIFNRGMSKQLIFHDNRDRIRFLFLILYFQSPIVIQNIGRPVKSYVKHSVFNTEEKIRQEIVKSRFVELTSFCLMPNHFHLIVKEVEENGIARYMQRVLNSYTKYYNTKYNKSGHLFQGPYKAVHIKNNNQLLYLSSYIHRNPREMKEWFNKEDIYPWSSYQDCVSKNRFEELLVLDIINGQFKNKKEYDEFVKTSPAKLLEEELDWIN